MKIRVAGDLVLLNLVVLLLIVVFFLSAAGALRIILGLPVVLFFPGYVLMIALFPRKSQMDGIQRLALSFGLSLALTPLIGLALNSTPWGLAPEPFLLFIAAFILSMSVVAWLRRRRLPLSEVFVARLGVIVSRRSGSGWEKTVSALLVVAIVGTVAAVGYLIAEPKSEEEFTEFYVLGLEGEVIHSAWNVVVGQESQVIIGISNLEHQTVSYQLDIALDGEMVGETEPITLDHSEKWERPVGFTIGKAGDGQKLEFLLHRSQGTEALQSLHLWINATER